MRENLYVRVRAAVVEALQKAVPDLPADVASRVEVTPARDPAHGDMATNAAMVAAKAARQPPAKLAAALATALAGGADVLRAEAAGPGFVNLHLRLESVLRDGAGGAARGRAVRRQRGGRRQGRQRGIRLRQPDRADAYRPLPRRRGRRCAGQPAGQGRVRRHQGILHQRRRRPGRRPRLGRLLALPAGARHQPDRGGVRRGHPHRPAV